MIKKGNNTDLLSRIEQLENENRVLRLQIDELTLSKEESTHQLLHYAPQVMLLVNSKYEVVRINRYTDTDNPIEDGGILKTGDVLRCVHALNETGGCGTSENCRNCIIRNTIKSTFVNKSGISGVYTELPTSHLGQDSLRYVQVSTRFLENENQNNVAIYVNDITELNNTQQALLESEERFELAVGATNDGIWDWDLRDNTLFLSKGWKEMLGYKEYELDHDISTWENLIHPDDKQITLQQVADFIDGTSSKYECEFRLKHKRGHYIEVFSRGQMQVDYTTGKPFRLIGTHVDLTTIREKERKIRESEERYRSVVNAMMEGVVMQDADGKIVFCNGAAEKILGLTFEQLQGRSSIDPRWRSVHEDMSSFPGEEHPVMVSLKTGLPQHRVTMGVHKPNGTLSWIKVNSEPIFIDNSTDPFGVVATFADITEERNALNELEQNNRMKDRFFSILSHDLKIPFNALLGFSELLRESIEEKDFENIEIYSNYIHDSAQRNFNLLMNLLDWSRSQSGTIHFSPEQIDLTEVLASCREFLTDALHNKHIEIEENISFNKLIWADKNMLNTVLRNLISNAIKFSYEYGMIEIEIEDRDHDILFAVKDYGVGIKEKFVSKLFKADSGYKTTGTKDEEGTGLGLILCKELVEKHNGKIWVKSIYNVGTTFYFTIPKNI